MVGVGGHNHSAHIPAYGWLRRDCPHFEGDGPRPVRAGFGLALGSGRSVRRGSRVKRNFAFTFTCSSTCAGCPAHTVTLEAGGADTYTQRAIPGSEPSQSRPCSRRCQDGDASPAASWPFTSAMGLESRGHGSRPRAIGSG